MNLGALLVFVPDLDVARDFYGRVLEMPLVEASPAALVFALGTHELRVFKCERDAAAREHGRDAASVIVFEVASLDAQMARLRSEGVVFLHKQPAVNEHMRVRYAAFLAPGGNVHELMERL